MFPKCSLIKLATIYYSSAVLSVFSMEYTAIYQPELDWVNVDPYIHNERLFNLQVKCIIEDGPCDIVGRWVRPRVAAALLGTCIKCTPHQEGEVNKFLSWVQENRPEIFREAVKKYIEQNGITLPPNHSFGPVENSNTSNDPPTDDTESATPGVTTFIPSAESPT